MKWLIGISVLAIGSLNAFDRPYGSLLVNYGAIGNDSLRAEIAAEYFDIIIDQAYDMGQYMLRLSPALQVLKYNSICQAYTWLTEWDEIDKAEDMFLHSYDPASVSLSINGPKVRIKWANDRRFDDVIGYLLFSHNSSQDSGVLVIDTLVKKRFVEIDTSQLRPFLSIWTVRADSSIFKYSYVDSLNFTELMGFHIGVDSIDFKRLHGVDSLFVTFYVSQELTPDSLKIQIDEDHDKVYEDNEYYSLQPVNDSVWGIRLGITNNNNYKAGYGFRFIVYHGGVQDTFPETYSLSTNVNNRLKDVFDYYLMDISAESWIDFKLRFYMDYASNDNYTGLFADNTIATFPYWLLDVPTGVFDYDTSNWYSDMVNLIDTLQSLNLGLHIFNGLAVQGTDTFLLNFDGGMFEHWVYRRTGPVSYPEWKRCENTAIKARYRYHKIFMPLNDAPEEDTSARLFSFASFLLIADDSTFYANADSLHKFAIFPEMMLDLGAPIDTAFNDIEELNIQEGLYIRRFEKGFVVVNPTDNPLTFVNNFPTYRLAVSPGTAMEGSVLSASIDTNTFDTFGPKTAGIFVYEPIESPKIEEILFKPERPSPFQENKLSVKLAFQDSVEVTALFRNFKIQVDLLDNGQYGDSLSNDSIFVGIFHIPFGVPNIVDTVFIIARCSNGIFSLRDTIVTPIIADPYNLVYNWSFEIDADSNNVPDSWMGFEDGFTYDTTTAHLGGYSIKCESPNTDLSLGVYKLVHLNQHEAKNIVISGYSKAFNASGSEEENYSIYANIYFMDGSVLQAQYAPFSEGTHDWQYVKHIIFVEKPIKDVFILALFKHHTGTVWFDDVGVYEAVPMDVDEKGELKIEKPDFYFTVIPNPVGDFGILRAYVPGKEPRVLRLYNTAGRLVRTFGLKPGLNLIRWETGDLPNGAYFLYSESPKRTLKTLILK